MGLLSKLSFALLLALPIACQGQEGQGEAANNAQYMPAPSPNTAPQSDRDRPRRADVMLELAVSDSTRPVITQAEPVESTREAAELQAGQLAQAEAQLKMSNTKELATFGAGCYWCVEAVLEQVDGVESVVSGFMGGASPDVTYEEVCSGRTGHAEVVHVTFDPGRVSYDELLDWFWRLHDPTTLNRQGADRGTQYRSAIFFHSAEQEAAAKKSMAAAGASFATPIVTEITAASELITGPPKHQDFYRQNKTGSYCRNVIAPKLKKLGLKQ